MQETAFVDSQGGLLSSRGGAQTHWHRHIGTSLTMVRKEKKISSSLLPIITILYCTSSNLVDKLQNSALLLRQTAKLRGCMGDVNAVSCHPALCRPRASTFQNKSFTELLLFKVKAQVWNKILFVKKISL